MTVTPYLSIILPTYNESENIIPLINEIKSLISCTHEIIVVDDDSPDGTWQLIEDHQKKHTNVFLLHRKNERGLTSAINSGIQKATGKYVMWMDVDFSMPPNKIPELLHAIENGATVAVGSRYVLGGEDARAVNFHLATQRLLSKWINLLCSKLLHCSFTDWTSGFIILERRLIENYNLTGDYGEYFIHLINYLCDTKDVCIAEIPYTIIPREKGESKTATNLWGFAKRGRKYVRMVWDLYKSGRSK